MKNKTILKRLVKARPIAPKGPLGPLGPGGNWYADLSIDPSAHDLAVAIQDLYERVKKLEKKK